MKSHYAEGIQLSEVRMRLSCEKASVLALTLTIACHDSTAPSPRDSYLLESVNGQPVPTVIRAGGGDTTTLFWATLTLDAAGKAEIVAATRRVSTSAPPREATDIARYSYRVFGDSIAFDYSPPCPPNALCVRPPYGKITGLTVNLFLGANPAASYIYRLAPWINE